jgi:hypothetical protein
MRHVKLRPAQGIDATALRRLIRTAYADIKRQLEAGDDRRVASVLSGPTPHPTRVVESRNMKRRLSPREKKENEYDRDRIVRGWNSGAAFRKKWHKKEQDAQQAFRRTERVAVAQAARSISVEDAERPIRRRELKRSRPATVRESVLAKTARRERSHGAKAARDAYVQRARTTSIESALGRVMGTRVVGPPKQLWDVLGFVLSSPELRHDPGEVKAFLAQHPGWMAQLRAWRNAILVERGRLPKRSASKGKRSRPAR